MGYVVIHWVTTSHRGIAMNHKLTIAAGAACLFSGIGFGYVLKPAKPQEVNPTVFKRSYFKSGYLAGHNDGRCGKEIGLQRFLDDFEKTNHLVKFHEQE